MAWNIFSLCSFLQGYSSLYLGVCCSYQDFITQELHTTHIKDTRASLLLICPLSREENVPDQKHEQLIVVCATATQLWSYNEGMPHPLVNPQIVCSFLMCLKWAKKRYLLIYILLLSSITVSWTYSLSEVHIIISGYFLFPSSVK